MHILEGESQQEPTVIDREKSVFVIDGNALIRGMTKLPQTFGEFGDMIFHALAKASTVHFVTDSYYKNSIKTIERSRRSQSAVHIIGGPMTKLPRDFARFMHEAENKRQLLSFLLARWQQPQFASLLRG